MNNLNKSERQVIETMHNVGHSVPEISQYLGRHQATIYRELNKFKGVDGYNAEIAHKTSRQNMARNINRGPDAKTISIVEEKILNEQWSPEQISGWLKLNHYKSVSHSWIYRYIAKDKELGGELHNHLRHGNYTKGHKEYRGNIKDRICISQRPIVVNHRERLGDYEVDLIVGPKNRGAILTIVDRKSRECVLEKLTSKQSETVSISLINALENCNCYSITSDNGSEFSEHKCVSKALKAEYYFAHPYASYERGSIENLNGLVRQYIPKGTSFDNIDRSLIKEIQHKLNSRPRKVLDFKTPIQYKNIYDISQ